MRVLHSAFSKKLVPGIANQMYFEQIAAESMGLKWQCLLCVSEMDVDNNIKKDRFAIIMLLRAKTNLLSKLKYYSMLKAESEKYDVILLRYNMADPLQYLFLKVVKKPIYLVHHTIELSEILSRKTLKSKVKFSIEKLLGQLSLGAASGVIAVTNEILNYECSRANKKIMNKFVYPNGILTSDTPLIDLRNDITPEFVFIASNFAPWHGLDLLLNDLKNSSSNFILHIVGNVSEYYIKLANEDKRVIFHGLLDSDDIKEIMGKSWLGLSSFALYRNNMREASTLKVREYLNNGVPVYSGYNDIFPEGFLYYKTGKPIFEDIISFAKKVRLDSKKQVRSLSTPYIDKKHILKDISVQLKNIMNQT